MDNTPTQAYLDRLIQRLNEGPVFIITANNICRPYTLNNKDSNSFDKLWCLVHERFESVDPTSIRNYIVYEDVRSANTIIQRGKDAIKNVPEGAEDIYFNQHVRDREFHVLRELNFTIDYEDVCNDSLSEEQLSDLRTLWMDKIREQRADTFKELDGLEDETKREGGSEDDLEDIQTIKQMFRDIPQDVDLTQYKSIKELSDFWPSLLLPAPEFVNNLHQWVGKMIPTEADPDPHPEEQLDIILSNITDPIFLSKMLKEINDTPMTAQNSHAGIIAIERIQDRLRALNCEHLIS